MTEVEQNAYLLMASVKAAVVNGVRHYSGGRLLQTPLSIIQALQMGAIRVDERDRVNRTSTEREYSLLTGERMPG